jgi:hypothetical protein
MMVGLIYRHVTEEGAEKITEDRARILIESRYQPSVHAVMLSDLRNGSKITVRAGYVEVSDEVGPN